MSKPIFALLFCLTLLFSACTLPSTYTTPPADGAPNLAYTAAAQTIEAQLTQIAIGSVVPPQEVPAQNTPAAGNLETLPATSTPPPSSTPLPSDTPTVTPTVPSATPTPIPSATLPPTATTIDPKAGLGEPDWQDQFASAGNWPLYTDEHVEMSVQSNQLRLSALQANPSKPYDAWMLSWPTLTNFYLQAAFTTGSECSGRDRYGLLARAPGFDPISAYIFGVSCDGRYALRIWNGSKYTMLIEWTPSEHIKQGPDQTNILGLRAEGTTLTLSVNDRLLYSLEDDTFSNGYFGLFVGAAQTDGFTVYVSEVSYWELP